MNADAVIRNDGNRKLDSLEIRLPLLWQPGSPVAVQVAGSPVDAHTEANTGQARLVVPLKPALLRGQSRRLAFQLAIAVPAGKFVLLPNEWFATLLPPVGLFAKGLPRADKLNVRILVPDGYQAMTTGRLRGVHTGDAGGQTEYTYEIRGQDFAPFLLVGRYLKQTVRAGRRNVVFWTRQTFDPGCAQVMGTEASATAKLYRSVFGPLGKNSRPIQMIQIPAASLSTAADQDPRAGFIPDAVLFAETPAEACGQRDRFSFVIDHSLAATWFGWAVRPNTDARAVLGDGVRDYAALIALENREGGNARGHQIAEWLTEYDRLRSGTEPLPPARLGLHPTGEQLRMAGIQSALCFVAIEDRFGPEPIQHALHHLIASLRGGTAGLDELRSALEQETKQNTYRYLNGWLGHAGIPAAFRRRYAAGNLKSALRKNPDLGPRRGK